MCIRKYLLGCLVVVSGLSLIASCQGKGLVEAVADLKTEVDAAKNAATKAETATTDLTTQVDAAKNAATKAETATTDLTTQAKEIKVALTTQTTLLLPPIDCLSSQEKTMTQSFN